MRAATVVGCILDGMREAAARAWLEQPVPLLAAFLVLSVLVWPAEAAVGGSNFSLPGLVILLFLTWRVSQGGPISRMLLILVSGADYSGAAFHFARMPGPADLWLLVASAGQVALLVSPAVYQRTRRSTVAGSAPTALAGRPRPWMLPWGLLTGLIITLLFLAQMRRTHVPGCGPAGAPLAHLPTRCIGLGEGYPLRFLYAYQRIPKIDRLALMKDWAQWSLIGTSALYALELLRAGRVPAVRSKPRPEPALSR